MGLRDLFSSGRDRKVGDKIQRGVLLVAVSMLLAMLVTAILLSLSVADGGAGIAAFALFVAAAAVGAALGFLFGLPRARVAEESASTSTFYLTNSNLIKVSDWLTTIVI